MSNVHVHLLMIHLGEIDLLLALFLRAHGGDGHIDLTGLDSGHQSVEGHILDLDLDPHAGGNFID